MDRHGLPSFNYLRGTQFQIGDSEAKKIVGKAVPRMEPGGGLASWTASASPDQPLVGRRFERARWLGHGAKNIRTL